MNNIITQFFDFSIKYFLEVIAKDIVKIIAFEFWIEMYVKNEIPYQFNWGL